MSKYKKITKEAIDTFLNNKKIPSILKIEIQALDAVVDDHNNLEIYRLAYGRIMEILMELPDDLFKKTVTDEEIIFGLGSTR